MSKSILMSIQPKWVAKILNGEKTIEVRKKFPVNYRGWVYIYCTKDKKYANLINRGGFLTGMVVARFWCDKVYEIEKCKGIYGKYTDKYIPINDFMFVVNDYACLTTEELDNYLKGKDGYAIHISKLEIFGKPKELSEFYPLKWEKCDVKDKNGLYQCDKCPYADKINFDCKYKPLTKAPQSWRYMENKL